MAPHPPLPPSTPLGGEGEKRGKRALILVVGALYAFSIVAAVVLGGRREKDEKDHKSLLAMKKEDRIAWIPIHGPIYASDDGSPFRGGGAEYWARKLRTLGEKDEVKAIVLEINSPGGSVGAVQELHAQILRLRKEKKKPVVALLGDVAASGGYYLAAACDKVIAHPGSLTGSIGVIMEIPNVEGLFAKIGVKMDPVKSGKHKDIGSPTRAMTPEERKILQDLINDAYEQFLGAVGEGRKMDIEKLRPLADGRIFTGRQAKDEGLVDMLGSSTDALRVAGELGHIQGTPKLMRVGEPLDDLMTFLDSKLSAPVPWAGLSNLGFAKLEYMWRL